MRYKPEHKNEMRKKMITAVSQGFREHGYSGIGVDGLAKVAGVTSGAFYTHFGSKDAAFTAALEYGLDEVIEGVPVFQEKGGKYWIEDFVKYYLGRAHRDNLAGGCSMTSLSPEVIRTDPATHKLYETKMDHIANLLAVGLKGGSEEQRRARTWAFLGVLIGGLTIARAAESNEIADEIAISIQKAALVAAGDALSTKGLSA